MNEAVDIRRLAPRITVALLETEIETLKQRYGAGPDTELLALSIKPPEQIEGEDERAGRVLALSARIDPPAPPVSATEPEPEEEAAAADTTDTTEENE